MEKQADQERAEPKGPSNRLAGEKSPYLLQHAHNPVDWYPWGEEAFERARREDKPIFLSIGYSTCHWCHVMERESFEDPQVAALMNEALVNIKVDREERPDIDEAYMTVAQMMTGGGGWPLTIVMTPEKVPFFAATYIPRENRWGRTGMLSLIPAIQDGWKTRRGELLRIAEQVTAALSQATHEAPGEPLSEQNLDLAFQQLSERFDAKHGGFGGPPKFPTPHNLLFLLRYWNRTGREPALRMVERTLTAMRNGGIFDHVGFGYHRYSTDARWLLPHFEKMLYDQAMLAMAFVEAYQATKKESYRTAADEVFTYVLRDMTSPQGGFYSAEDADSEGVEGKFYLWAREELRQALGEEEAALVARVYGVEEDGNFAEEASGQRSGQNILHLSRPLAQWAEELNLPEQQLSRRLEAALRLLFERRELRTHPLKDDKVLTDWNGLMIAALAKGARAFAEPRYAEAAKRAAEFLLMHMSDGEGRLLHRYRDGESALGAYAADYAFLVWGLLELYEATFEVCYLERAVALNAAQIDAFWDESGGGFFSTSADGEELLVRQKDIYDGAVPSANSVALMNLVRLARMTADAGLESLAERLGRAFSPKVAVSPTAHTQLMMALDLALGPSCEVVVAGPVGAPDVQKMLQVLGAEYAPNKVVLFRPDGESPDISRLAAFTKDFRSLGGRATAYVCRNHSCEAPSTDLDAVLDLLRQGARRAGT